MVFFQKTVWILAGAYVAWMLVRLAIGSFYESGSLNSIPENPYQSLYWLVGLLVLISLSNFGFVRAFQKFKELEMECMAKMVGMLFPKVEFSQGVAAPKREINDSKLFTWLQPNTPIYSYGQIRAHSQKQAINIADISLMEKDLSRKTMDGVMAIPGLNLLMVLYQYSLKNIFTNQAADNQHFTFRGMFCWLKFVKKLNGHTVVLPKSQLHKINRLASFNFQEEQQIHLEDPRFTDSFDVYSTDQVEARYVLSSVLMERIVTLKERFDRPVFLSFQNKQLYLAIENPNGLFSFPSGNLDQIGVVEEMALDIETALQVHEELNN